MSSTTPGGGEVPAVVRRITQEKIRRYAEASGDFNPIHVDEEYARLRGLKVEIYYLLLLCLTALTVVSLISVVGIVMAIALLTLPAATAGHFSKTLWHMMVLAMLFSAAFAVAGLALSYGANLPAGATIVVVAGVVYISVTVAAGLMRRRRQA